MKNYLVLIVSVLCFQTAFCQVDTAAPYKRFPTVPPMQLTQIDSSLFTKESLKKNQPLILMYFSPVCDHCKHQIDDMLKRMSDLKHYQIVLATYQPLEELEQFYKAYGLSKYSNIKLGRDTKFTLPPFFRIGSLPYLALYDKKGNLLTTFEGNVKVDKLLKAFGKG